MGEQNGAAVGLEPCDFFGVSCLADRVDGLANPHAQSQRLQILVNLF
jgi:hypothetical protein